MKLDELQHCVGSRVNELRCLLRTIESKNFLFYFKRASEQDRAKVCEYVASENNEAVCHWLAIQEKNSALLEELPVRDLRRIAASLRVKDYNRLSKAVLLSEIKRANNYDHSPDHQVHGTPLRGDEGSDTGLGCPGVHLREDHGGGPGDDHAGGDVGTPSVPPVCPSRTIPEGSGDLATAPR